ncbi:MAG: hypothetical protein WC341_15365 [Bacteroidales bacterium]
MNTIEKRKKVEALLSELRSLQGEISHEESHCNHQWGAVQYDPEHYREPTGFKLVAQGSDCWSEAEGYRDATRSRWSRTCLLCGKKEFTTKQKVEKTVPDFGK